MENYVYTKPYSTLIIERQGKGFSEVEITKILQEILPQLTQIHVQGLGHGAISADALAQDQSNFKSVLLNSTGFANSSYVAPEQLQTGQISTSGDIYALGVTMIVLLTGKSPESLRNNDGSWNWQDDCFVSDQLAGILEQAIAIYPQYRYADAMQMLSAINSTFMDKMPQMQPTLIQTNNLQSYQPTYPISTPSPQIYKLTKLQLVLISSGITILISLAGFGLLQLLNPRQNVQTIAESSTSSPTIENTPVPINSSTPEPAPTYSNSVSETKLDQVMPSYIASAFSPTNSFANCPENTKLYLIGETEKFRFAVCGANGQSLYYFGLDKTTGSGIKLSGSDSGFQNGNYLYLPPSYKDTNYTNALLRVYQNNNLIVSHPIISLYKLAENNSAAISGSPIGWGLLNQANKARQEEAKNYISSMNKGEQATQTEFDKFTNNIQALGLGIKTETENYSYSINILSNIAVQPIAIAKKDGLKSYSGGVFLISISDDITTVAIICETEKPSKTIPPAPQLVNDRPQCAPGTVNLYRN